MLETMVRRNTETMVGDVDLVMQQAFEAFQQYRKLPHLKRVQFLEAIAEAIEGHREELVQIAMTESHLPQARLTGELTRTINQLRMFAELVQEGSWVEATIDAAPQSIDKPDTRKMLVPVGPVIVFGASNFPFAFSTAGGDTASALASGSTVVIKGHSAHAQTSELMFSVLQKAIESAGVPTFPVQHMLGSGASVGKALVMHPLSTGVGFTGSFAGGKALVEYAHQRELPIPVFAEMSSINPVVFYPDALQKDRNELAIQFAGSITLGAGQFCTNPGILLGIKSIAFEEFLHLLGQEITKVPAQKMLHSGIYTSYQEGLKKMLAQSNLQVVAQSGVSAQELEAVPVITSVPVSEFIRNATLREEVFGPYSLVVVCEDRKELIEALQSLKGQLTSTLIATDKDLEEYAEVIDIQHSLAGRILLNGVPTGVEVCASMVHGGPYPATTDARFTSVGTGAIKRWVRPVCLQNFSDHLLPDALKNENPLGILRLVNKVYTRDALKEM